MHFDIAVVMATYKRPQLLERCLTCLVNQELDKRCFEVVVVSDGPDEVTTALIRELSNANPEFNIRLLCLPVHSGPAAARNAGWQHANAHLIAFTDDDCMPATSWLKTFLGAYEHSENNMVFTGRVKVPMSNVPTDYEKNIAGLETADFITANCCCPTHVLQKVGGFDPRFETAWREDSDLHFNLVQHGIPIKKLNKALVVHPVRPAPWGVSIREQKKSSFNALLYKKYPSLYRSHISKGPVKKYYVIILSFVFACFARGAGYDIIAICLFLILLTGVMHFTALRLRGTSKSFSHILEMFVTSFIIPFTSIFWTWYGALKYRVFFL